MTLEFKPVRIQNRTYIFPNDAKVTIEDVVKVAVSASTHRLETSAGKKYIVPNGWLAIELDMDEWSF